MIPFVDAWLVVDAVSNLETRHLSSSFYVFQKFFEFSDWSYHFHGLFDVVARGMCMKVLCDSPFLCNLWSNLFTSKKYASARPIFFNAHQTFWHKIVLQSSEHRLLLLDQFSGLMKAFRKLLSKISYCLFCLNITSFAATSSPKRFTYLKLSQGTSFRFLVATRNIYIGFLKKHRASQPTILLVKLFPIFWFLQWTGQYFIKKEKPAPKVGGRMLQQKQYLKIEVLFIIHRQNWRWISNQVHDFDNDSGSLYLLIHLGVSVAIWEQAAGNLSVSFCNPELSAKIKKPVKVPGGLS